MAEKQQMQAPAGMAGLVRYYDEDKSLLKMKPEHVIGMCVGFIAIEVIMVIVL